MTPGATADPGAVPPIPMTGGGSEVDGPATGPGALFLSAPNPVWAGGAPTVPASWVAVPGAAAAPAATCSGRSRFPVVGAT